MTAVPKKPSKPAPAEAAPRRANGADGAVAVAPEPSYAPAANPAWQSDFMADLRLEGARIPRRFLGKALENFTVGRDSRLKAVLQASNLYVSGFTQDAESLRNGGRLLHKKGDSGAESRFYAALRDGSGLLLKGSAGCGKTHIAVAVLKAIVAKGYRGLYYNITDLLVHIRETYSADSSIGEADFLDEIQAPDLLVIDDLGAQKNTEWVNDRLYLIVNRRYEACRPLLVTTNLMTIEEMEQSLGKRITSRLCEMCSPFLEFPNEDYRKNHMH
jgi:hypothetical protein